MLRKILIQSLCFSLMLEPLLAAEIALNQISNISAVQDIRPHPAHPGQYSVQLSADLWDFSFNQPILLKNQEIPLAILYRESPAMPLLLKVLDRENSQDKQVHLHLYPIQKETSGPLAIQTTGRLSLYPGTYQSLQAEAGRIYLNKNKSDEKEAIRVNKKLLLTATNKISQRSPVTVKGNAVLKSDKAITLTNKISSKGKIYFQGETLRITDNGTAFSTLEINFFLDRLTIQGRLIAPLMSIACQKEINWQKSQCYGFALTLHTNHSEFDRAKFFLRQGLLIKGRTAAGNGEFHIGGHQNWHFPKLNKHKDYISPIQGCHWDVDSLNLDDQTRFQIKSGETTIKSIFAKIRGEIRSGVYNRYPLTLETKQSFSLEGILSVFESHLSSLRGEISGFVESDKLVSLVNHLHVSGDLRAKDLTTAGNHLDITETGSIRSNHHSFDHQNISVEGHWTAGSLEGRTNQLTFTPTANAVFGQAHLESRNTTVSGTLSVGSLDLQGNTFTVSPTGQFKGGSAHLKTDHTSVSGSMDVGSVNVEGTSFNLSATGQLTADSVTNSATQWGLAGKGSIKSFYTSIPEFTLSGSEDFTINQAKIRTNSTTFSGHLNIQNLDLSTQSWKLAAHAILEGAVQVTADRAALEGIISGDSLAGLIRDCHLLPTAKIQSSHVNLAGDLFNNQGSIDASSGIQLAYDSYSLGSLSTRGTLSLELNDRHIDEYLLKDFERQFKYNKLALRTEQQHVTFTQSLELYRSLALSAPSISFESNKIQETRKVSKGCFRFSVPTWHTPIQNFIIHGDLHLESRDHSLSLSHFNLSSHNGFFLSGSDFILNDSTIRTQQKLLFDVKGNTVLNRIHRPSLLGAGHGGMQGSIEGKLIVNASDLFSGGTMEISAHRGFEFNAYEIVHQETHTKRYAWYEGGGKRTTVHEWNEILSPTVTALGPITFLSSEGGADFDSTLIVSPEDVTIATKEAVTNLERKTFDHTDTKKNTFFSSDHETRKVEGDAPTVMTSSGKLTIASWDDRIHLPNTILIAAKVLLEAYKDIEMSLLTLMEMYTRDRKGFTFSHALSDVSKDPTRSLLNLHPVTGALQSLYDARSDHPINQISAGVTAGIAGYNTYQGYQNYQKALANKGNFGSNAFDQILANLCRVEIGYYETSVSMHRTYPGRGGIFSPEAEVKSHFGNIRMLNGVPLDVAKLTISCPRGVFTRGDFKSTYRMDVDSFNFSVGVNLATISISDVSVSASSSESEGVRWLRQKLTDPNPTIDAASVVYLTGEDYSYESPRQGFGFSIGRGGSFSCQVGEYGFGYAAPSESGMLGSLGVQAKGVKVVVPLSAGSSQAAAPQAAAMSPSTQAQLAQTQDLGQLTADQPALTVPRESMKRSVERKPVRHEQPHQEKETAPESPSPSLPNTVLLREKPQDLGPDYSWIVEGSSTPSPVVEPNQEPKTGYIESIGSSVISASVGFVEWVVDLGVETGSLIKDTAFLYAAHADEALVREYALSVGEDQYSPTIKDTVGYGEAIQNMEQRGKTLQSLGNTVKDGLVVFGVCLYKSRIAEVMPWLADQEIDFEKSETFQGAIHRIAKPIKESGDILNNMTGPQWAGVYAGLLTSYVLPGGLIKSAGVVMKPVKSLTDMNPAKHFTQLKTFVSSRMPTLKMPSFNLAIDTEVGFSRPLLWEDLGIKKSPLHFDRQSPNFLGKGYKLPADGYELSGSVALITTKTNKTLRVRVNNIKAPLKGKTSRLKGLSPLSGPEIIENLTKLAQTSGADQLMIRATVVNPRLKHIIETRYNGEREFAETVLKFAVPKAKPNPNMLLLPAPKGAIEAAVFSEKPLSKKNIVKRNNIGPVPNPEAGNWYLNDFSYSKMRSIADDFKISESSIVGSYLDKNKKAPYIIFGHGTEKIMYSKDKPWDAKKVSSFIQKTSRNEQREIFLWSCSTGKGKNPIAQQVADELNRIIHAPNGIINIDCPYVWVSPTGYQWLNNLIKKFNLPFYGEIKTFHPRQIPSSAKSTSHAATSSRPKKLAFESLEEGKIFAASRRFDQRLGGTVSLISSPNVQNTFVALSGVTAVGIGLWAKQQIDDHFLQNGDFIPSSILFKKKGEKGSRHFSDSPSKRKGSFSPSFHPDPDDDDDNQYIGKDKKKEKKKLREKMKERDEGEGRIDLNQFDQRMDGDRKAWKNSRTGWYIEEDFTKHGGKKYWKLKSPKGGRVLSLDPKGNIVSG